MLYPAAFAHDPVFRLPGWYDDDPWGTGFERPPAKVVEGLLTTRAASASAAEALAAWGIGGGADDVDPRLVEREQRPRLLSCAEDGTDGAEGGES